ncbi:MAG: hypothetical protein COA77_02755 [Thaumarchaeota archaeon]|nr:MAG: hypothetical protein COA77_02755 [Nitrososphaerota archaeon]
MTFNIFECTKCQRKLIAEEISNHKCKTMKEYKIIDDTLWVSDGEKWYPLKLNQPKLDSQKNNRGFDRTVKQHSYKVLVPYYTVW